MLEDFLDRNFFYPRSDLANGVASLPFPSASFRSIDRSIDGNWAYWIIPSVNCDHQIPIPRFQSIIILIIWTNNAKFYLSISFHFIHVQLVPKISGHGWMIDIICEKLHIKLTIRTIFIIGCIYLSFRSKEWHLRREWNAWQESINLLIWTNVSCVFFMKIEPILSRFF